MKKIFMLIFICIVLVNSYPTNNTAYAATRIWDGSIATSFASGSGTTSDPYVIKTASQLAYLAKSVNQGNTYRNQFIVLKNDICLNVLNNFKEWNTNPPKNKWTPIGNSSDDDFYFAGNFDGEGHTIRGIYINSYTEYSGLFGFTRAAKINNVSVISSYIKGTKYVGGIIGFLSGRITNCYSNATVIGTQYVGGILGYGYGNPGELPNYSPSPLYVLNCRNDGNVSGTSDVGGIAGYIYTPEAWIFPAGSITIQNVLNTGLVNNGSGIPVGYVSGGGNRTISSCYYLDTSGNGGIGTLKTSAELKKRSTYAGFNFSTIWGIDEDKDYPYLRVIYEASKPIDISSVSMFSLTTTMKVGDTKKIIANVLPQNATDKNLTWSTNNSLVATVDNNGIVSAKGPGKATITAKSSNGKKASCVVTVTNVGSKYYGDYKYPFMNHPDSFGYSNEKDEIGNVIKINYKIPEERYLQLGYPEHRAKSSVKTWGGNCFGMSMSSILFYKDILKEENYHVNGLYEEKPSLPAYLFWPDKNKKLREMIELLHISQNLNSATAKPFNLHDVLKELSLDKPIILGMYEEGRKKGHAIVINGYSQNGSSYDLEFYDCGYYITSITCDSDSHITLTSTQDAPQWKIFEYYCYDDICNIYQDILENGKNSATLFSNKESLTYTQIIVSANDMKISNIQGEVLNIQEGEIFNEIEDIKLIPSSYLAEEQTYTIILPTDTYTIVGSGDDVVTTSFAADYISASVTAKSSTPITISSDLKEISVDTAADEEYDITYTTYDNIFDEMTLSGIATGRITSKLKDADILVTGANTITALASVSDSVVSANSDSISNSDEITVKCEESDSGATIQLLNADTELTGKTSLPERLTVATPVYDLRSGSYTESQVLNFTKDDDTIIYYTTDGSTPSADNGIIYSLPIDINKSMTIKAISTKYGYLDSKVLRLSYYLPKVDTPQANIESGEYDKIITVELLTDNYDDTIYYTLDGSNPLENGILYTVPINICKDSYLQTYAIRNGCISEISEYEYTVTPSYPFYFCNSLTNQDGEIITPDNIDDVTKVKLTLSKLHTGDHTGVFLIAFYDIDDRLIYGNYKSVTISEDVNEVEIDITGDVSSTYKVKVFAWKDLLSLQPICETLEENIILK